MPSALLCRRAQPSHFALDLAQVHDSMPIEDKIDRLAELTEILYSSVDAASTRETAETAVKDRVVRRMAAAAAPAPSTQSPLESTPLQC